MLRVLEGRVAPERYSDRTTAAQDGRHLPASQTFGRNPYCYDREVIGDRLMSFATITHLRTQRSKQKTFQTVHQLHL
ncbi:hypothetical protein EVAR_89347_1 [Eumeta japonica]|uniref:Uncharacterized protein n=1 Tax=Eumeta variegata TaxID=151549 RepID=A0A4C1Y3B0_EUMVA|nr:hypothetical protein EVAR_89347_1 [Eumeta japonica]